MADAFPLDLSRMNAVRVRNTLGAPRDGGRRAHRGTDIPAPRGTPVRSMTAGRVVAVLEDEDEPCGLGVAIRGDDGLLYTYCHFGAPPLFGRGETVAAGDVIGVVGTSGNAREDGPHLHVQAEEGPRGARTPVNLVPRLEAAYETATGRLSRSTLDAAREALNEGARRITRAANAQRTNAGIALALVLAAGAALSARKRRGNA